MQLSRLPRSWTWIGQDDDGHDPVFACQAHIYGDRAQVHSIMSRRPGALADVLPLIVADARSQGITRLEGYMKPFVAELLQRSAQAHAVRVEVGEWGMVDGMQMRWVVVFTK